MKYPSNRDKRYVVSVEEIVGNKLKLYGLYKQMLIYETDKQSAQNIYIQDRKCIQYLDIFVVVLSDNHSQNALLWRNFYECFGDRYSNLIDIDNNIACVNAMIDYIKKGVYKETPLVLLDYGCGNGISSSIIGRHNIYGYEPIEIMRKQALENGIYVFGKENLCDIPNDFFDAIFSCYVFHMSISEDDILQMVPKMKIGAPWIVNYYKGICEDYTNTIFSKNNFSVKKITLGSERFGNVYEYRKKE